jgi:pimeloyl-ACP methyl ester carboxylesterase
MNEQRRVPVGQRQLWAERIGKPDHPAVLLLTGAAMQATTWEQPFLAPFLDTRRSIVRFDWRDIGLSTWERFRDHPYGIDDLVADCLAVLDAFDVEASDVVGFSMGGCIAQLLALSAPSRVRSLTLLSSGYASRIMADRGDRGAQLFALLAQPTPPDPDDRVRRLLEQWRLLCGRAFRFDSAEWELRARSWVERGQNPSCPHVRLGPQVFDVDRAQDLARVVIATQVLHGDDDPMFPLPHGRAIADTLPGATIRIYAGRGHDLHLDPEIARTVASRLPRPS